MATRLPSPAMASIRNTIAADVSPARLARFFTKEDHGYRIVPELRGVVVFTVQNVLADPPFSRLDLVSCRNLLIYLRPEAQAKVLSLFHFALRDGGILFLGGSETVGNLNDRFEPIFKSQRIYRHTGREPAGRSRFFARRRDGRAPARASGAGAGAPHRRASRRSRAAAAAGGLCAGLGADQPQIRVPLLPRSDGPLFAGGLGRAQPRPACHGARRPAQQAQGGDPAGERGARARHRLRRAGERWRQHRRVSIAVQPVQSEGEELLLVSFLDEPARRNSQAVRSSRPRRSRGSKSSSTSSTPPAGSCRTPSAISNCPTKSRRRSTKKLCR